ncbi:MAG: LytR C-terminal domain-containing protein [Tessaracoccus sp.]|uniref:LytR C-terminal domain-containing protein n=1 Tax=Tessaracoccus sp. TaxID=1971211 RepID=UPI001ED44C1F|nr:LytR C-terminal domain-containing protein [Tessaracoccus sp.]MBK7820101.1 LytR C-terminal domain-containing protein [Tessaracoccus sp.]
MRIFRLIATPIIMLGLLAVLVWGVMWGWKELTAPLPTPTPTPCVTTSADVVTPEQVSLRVFNGGFTSGLASREAQRMRDKDFTVIKVDNVEERITSPVVRGNKREEPSMTLVASYYENVTLEFDDRVDGTVDLLLGSEKPEPVKKPLKKVETGGSLCVMATTTPSVKPSPSPSASQEP